MQEEWSNAGFASRDCRSYTSDGMTSQGPGSGTKSTTGGRVALRVSIDTAVRVIKSSSFLLACSGSAELHRRDRLGIGGDMRLGVNGNPDHLTARWGAGGAGYPSLENAKRNDTRDKWR